MIKICRYQKLVYGTEGAIFLAGISIERGVLER